GAPGAARVAGPLPAAGLPVPRPLRLPRGATGARPAPEPARGVRRRLPGAPRGRLSYSAAMATTNLTKFADLEAYLTENNVPHRTDAANQSVELPVNTGGVAGVMYLRWETKLPYVQIILPFVGNVPPERVHEVESAVCHANTVIPLPGFGYEYDKRFIFMRLCVPMYEEGMRAGSFHR